MAVNSASIIAGAMYEVASEVAAPSKAVGAALEPALDPEAEGEPEPELEELEPESEEPESEEPEPEEPEPEEPEEPESPLELVLVGLDESEVVEASVEVLDELLPVVVDEESSSWWEVELLALMLWYEPLVSVNL